jgi:NAD(P)H-dependent flavin oxidoreductase YrpB (nitropropane dioxygenase family)
MKTVTKPWIAFKVLAAGAIYPRQAFPYAFKSGADFIAVGMFDFQIKEDCELTAKVVRLTQDRERPWRA